MEKYGINRVIEPQHVLPTSAWSLDNSREIKPHEIRVKIKVIHIEEASFKQICMESHDDDKLIKHKIIDTIIKRGKLHNPVTDTGGLLYGEVDEIGEEYPNKKNLKKGDPVICNASLSSYPIYIYHIDSIDRGYCQISADGHAILYPGVPIVRKPEGMPVNLLLFTFNESGTLYKVSNVAVGKKKFLIVGNNLMTNILFGFAIRRVAAEDAEVVCLLDKKTEMKVSGKGVEDLISRVFTELHYVNILKPMECMEILDTTSLFDVSINCADIAGAETVNVLATKYGGTVVFSSLINNLNIALYITEAISRQLEFITANGYLEAYDEFDLDLVYGLMPYMNDLETVRILPNEETYDSYNRANMDRNKLLEDFVCKSTSMERVLQEVMTVAKYDCNILITGDTGVGKEKVATIIQRNSSRKLQPFVKINCASFVPSNIEIELFGYEKYDQRGRKIETKKGYLELADNGIILLDEIGALPLEMQAKLLRVIQDGEFFRTGGHKPVKVDVRIISSTNKDLEENIDNGLFRRDLYYRINVVRIRVPNLGQRKEDIPALIKHFLDKYNSKFHVNKSIDDEAVEYLGQMDWPGNIRELENVLQRLIISAFGDKISISDALMIMNSGSIENENKALEISDNGEYGRKEMSLEYMVNNFEKSIIKQACEKYGSTRKTAAAIGISQTQLVRKKKKYEL